jgi:L-ascorbate metabolism protein UlaG (beta-lactamase superfamily)
MRIEYLSGCTYLVRTGSGLRIVVDPYQHNYVPDGPPPPGGNQERPPVGERADIVTVSHAHFNYSYIYGVEGVPRLYTGGAQAQIEGVKLSGTVGWHYETGLNAGPQGTVNLIGIEVDGIRVRHLGDYGQPELSEEQAEQIGRVDVLMTRWMDWTPAVISRLKPRIVLPMHAGQPDAYMAGLKGFRQLESSTVEVVAGALPAEMECILLKSSRGES